MTEQREAKAHCPKCSGDMFPGDVSGTAGTESRWVEIHFLICDLCNYVTYSHFISNFNVHCYEE